MSRILAAKKVNLREALSILPSKKVTLKRPRFPRWFTSVNDIETDGFLNSERKKSSSLRKFCVLIQKILSARVKKEEVFIDTLPASKFSRC